MDNSEESISKMELYTMTKGCIVSFYNRTNLPSVISYRKCYLVYTA